MEKKLEDILPILGVEHDCIVSKQGDITIAYEARLPELFTFWPKLWQRACLQMIMESCRSAEKKWPNGLIYRSLP